TTAGAASSALHVVGEDGCWPAEVVPGHPSGEGGHHANGSQLVDRCQGTTMAVPGPLLSSSSYLNDPHQQQHQQQPHVNSYDT
ncbi:unnamed protein product, partial [Laminaria digitata]